MIHRQLFTFVCFLFILNTITAQTAPVKKIYAYKQASLGGKKPSEHETTVPKKEQYRLFIASGKGPLIIEGVWIEQEYYRVKMMPATRTPVLQVQQEGNERVILVPKTSDTVRELQVLEKVEPAPRPGSQLGKLLKTNELVMAYRWKGKQYFATSKTIKALSPFIGM
ncbi:MAG: hypothetical protein K2Q24_05345 [Chitinophagaceae bacterium]|jgi:hypothetical protein|nr:hypothetical protein [Chitinophagaceae bacterium]